MKTKRIALFATALISLIALGFGLIACNKTTPGYVGVQSQADIFTELNSMTADAGILDYTMASYLLSQNTSLTKDLKIVDGIEFETEQYGIAFRKGSTGLADKVNRALSALKDTKIAEIAQRYGLTDNVLSLEYTPQTDVNDDDWNAIVSRGKFKVGYTLNPPMAIKNGNELSGFDIDLPREIVNYLNQTYGTNLQIEFVLINWNLKETELQNGSIDCVWNGMTINADRLAAMQISIPYLLNRQCVVIRKADEQKYTDADSLKQARIVAERGSAGEDIGKSIFE